MSRYLLNSLGEIRERISRAPHLLLCLDFDGTLTPIATDPDAVCLPAQVKRLLQSLSHHAHVSLAIVSGRERADLQSRVGLAGVFYAGNHGLEISGPGLLFIEPAAAACQEAIRQLASDLKRRLPDIPGLVVENKGLTLSVHIRSVPDEKVEDVRRLVHSALANTNYPFQLSVGKKVYEIHPRVDWNKGSVVVWLKEQLKKPASLAIYLGDDSADEDAFTALAEEITVRVDSVRETAAHYYLEDTQEVYHFLEWLDHTIEGENQGARTRRETVNDEGRD